MDILRYGGVKLFNALKASFPISSSAIFDVESQHSECLRRDTWPIPKMHLTAKFCIFRYLSSSTVEHHIVDMQYLSVAVT